MNKIIKRLEIVKSAIELEDEEIIFQQVAHLKNEPLSVVPGTIVQAIEERRFGDALREISAWLQFNGQSLRGRIPPLPPVSWNSKHSKHSCVT